MILKLYDTIFLIVGFFAINSMIPDRVKKEHGQEFLIMLESIWLIVWITVFIFMGYNLNISK